MEQYNYNKYFAKKKFLKIFGGEVKIFDETKSKLLFFVKQKAFKLKEDITVYSDESKSQELLKIQARSIIDFSASYDVTDVSTGQKVGAIRRKGLKSILRDKWELLDPQDNSIGTVEEDSMLMAMLRRVLSQLIPQAFSIEQNGTQVGHLQQSFNPFVPQFTLDFSMDSGKSLDRRLGIAVVILLQIVEGKQG